MAEDGGPSDNFGEEGKDNYAEGELGGVRIPSHAPGKGGGSLGFNPHNPLPYNVVDTSGGAMKVVATVNPLEVFHVESTLSRDESIPCEEISAEQGLLSNEPVSSPTPAVPTTAIASRTGLKPMKKVTFTDFGELTVPYNDVFLDGLCLVLVYDKRNDMTFDPPVDEEKTLTIKYNGVTYHAYSSGVKFTEPGTSRVFTVLLVDFS